MPGDPRRRLISASCAPRGVERQALEDRRAELTASLRPTPGEQASDVIYALIAGFTAYGMSERETDVKVALYADALKTEPTWAIEAARQTFARGGWHCNWDGNGCPSSASVVAECKYTLLPIEAELYRIGLILNAELVDTDTTQDERDAAIAHWAEIRAGIASTNVIAERTDDDIQRERDAMQRANQVCRAKANAHLSELEARRAKREGESQQRQNVA
jgi:hypothetical protein